MEKDLVKPVIATETYIIPDNCTPPVCHPNPLDWSIEDQHLLCSDSEPRAVFNVEVPFLIWPSRDWSDCMNWTIVRYNWVREGHNDPLTHWNDDCDTLVNGTDSGYYGVGYANGHEENYYRCFSYNQPSWCENTWQFQVDCSNCRGNPNSCKSKGMDLPFPDNGWLWCDSTPPDFGYLDDSSDGITLVPAANLTDYVTSTSETSLSHKMINKGNVYGSNGSPLNWQQVVDYYNNNIGILLPQWIQQNPDGVWAVVIAHDHVTNQGKNIWNYLSVDATINGVNQCFTDVAEHIYFIDYSPYASGEKTQELWPFQHPDQSYYTDNLPIDGSPYGECSVWIVPVDCSYFSATSCRLRIRDDCNNWRRSQTITTDQQTLPQVHITNPQNNMQVSDGASVEFTADITGNDLYTGLESSIKWSVVVEEGGQPVNYGPNEDTQHQNWQSKISSTISPSEDWRGPTFIIQAFHDCTLKVRARLDICGAMVSDATCSIYWQCTDCRTGQTTKSKGCGGSIWLEVEPGRGEPSATHGWGDDYQENDEVYWTNGPSIPITESERISSNWPNDYSLENVPTDQIGGEETGRPRFIPIYDDLWIGRMRARVYVRLHSYYDHFVICLRDTATNEILWHMSQAGPWEYVDYCEECMSYWKGGYVLKQPGYSIPIYCLPPGRYTVEAQGQDANNNDLDDPTKIEVDLEYVKPANLVDIAEVYFGDGFCWVENAALMMR